MKTPKPETREIVQKYIAQGKDGNWLWTNLLQDVCKSEGFDVGERGKEAGEHATRVLRGIYPGRDTIWDAAFKNRTPDELNIELDHIIGICLLEADFTVSRRPIPPKPEPKPKKEVPEGEEGGEKKKGGRKPKAAADGAAPPPAPAAPPAAPPPPPAG